MLDNRIVCPGDAINWDNSLNRGLRFRFLNLPGQSKGILFRDLTMRLNGVLTNSPTWGGGYGGFGAVRFTAASSQYVNLGTWPGYAEYTLLSAFRLRSSGSNQAVTSADGDTHRVFQFRVNSSDQIQGIPFDNGGSPVSISGSTTLAVGGWYSVALTVKAGAGNCNLYLDGKSDAAADTLATIATGAAEWGIGARLPSLNEASNHDIQIVDVYNRVLSAGEIALWHEQWWKGFPDILNWTEINSYTEQLAAGTFLDNTNPILRHILGMAG